uniref:Reverse transcriptase domain-containing protein n=1 Tax=Nelumbo nucifera TaxID=4432 RepID=A0A822ZAI0_NELNU|nr:TPA_asm: hypothetical protein HUJ06_012850 [Nelumbo nucifera]
MKLLSWNCQEMGSPRAVRHISNLLASTKPDIIFLSETKASEQKTRSLMFVLGWGLFHIVEANGLSGGLCLSWCSNINLQILSTSRNLIIARTDDPIGRGQWDLLCAYGFPNREDRSKLWDFINSDHASSTVPWALIGDLNSIMNDKEKEDYSENLVQAWNSSEGSFITKCSQSKSKLWLWYSSKLNFKAKIKDLTHRIEDLQCSPSSPWTIAEETKLRKELEEWYKREEIYWKQRAKCNWLNYGDRNTRYFHISATNRKCKNALNLEIQQTFFSMNTLKAPGPNGLHALFFQNGWNVVGEDFCHFIRTLFVEPSRIASINDTCIATIPKKGKVETASDFRPIGLSNITYKVMEKLIANHLKPLLQKIISPFQNAFLPGRQIIDNVVVAREFIHSMNRSNCREGFFLLKVDLSKAYDRVEWSFLTQCLNLLGFLESICKLIKACIVSNSMKILINGKPSYGFSPERGLRQGCPLSPYLSIIYLEVFSRMLSNALETGTLKGFRFDRSNVKINHFVDDLLLVGRAEIEEVQHLNVI